jgi:hypothetical protein
MLFQIVLNTYFANHVTNNQNVTSDPYFTLLCSTYERIPTKKVWPWIIKRYDSRTCFVHGYLYLTIPIYDVK